MAYSPTGDCIALKNTSGQIALVNPADGKLVRKLDAQRVDGSDGASPVFSQCGRYIVDGTWRGELALYDCKTGKKVFEKSFDGEMISAIVRLKLGEKWIVIHQPIASDDVEDPAHLTKWNWPLPESKHQKLKLAIYEPDDAATDPEGKLLCVVNEFSNIHIYNVRGLKFRQEFNYDSPVTGIRWSHDGKFLIVVVNKIIEVYHSRTFDHHISFDTLPSTDCDISPSGDWVAVASGKTSLLIPRDNFFNAS